MCRKHKLQPDLEKAIHKRWFKSFQLDFLASANQTSCDSDETPHCSEEKGLQEVQIQSLPGPSFQTMSRNQRFNYVMRTLKTLADNLADCQPEVFASRLAFLEDVNASWLKGEVLTKGFDGNLVDLAACNTSSAQCDMSAGDPCTSSSTTVALPSVQNCGSVEDSKQSPAIKLPIVKCRGRPRKRVLQRQGHRNKWNEDHPMPFKHLSEESQQKSKCSVLLRS